MAALRAGIDADRLRFVKSIPKSSHMRRMRLVDLLLDTPVYNSHTSAGDAVWAALPLVTLPGISPQSRVAASILASVGIEAGDSSGLVVSTWDEYYDIALHYANNAATLSALRRRLWKDRLTASIFDSRQAFIDLIDLLHDLAQPDLIQKSLQQNQARFKAVMAELDKPLGSRHTDPFWHESEVVRVHEEL